MLRICSMEHGRDHDERQQKIGTRSDEQLERHADDDPEMPAFTRQARASDPAPTPKAVEEERARHARTSSAAGDRDAPRK